jgi:hypothetical protein
VFLNRQWTDQTAQKRTKGEETGKCAEIESKWNLWLSFLLKTAEDVEEVSTEFINIMQNAPFSSIPWEKYRDKYL